MKLEPIDRDYIVSLIVVNSGTGSKVLEETKKIGVSGGTIFLGKGTVKNNLLEILGIAEAKKEIVLIVSSNLIEEQIHSVLTKKFRFDKPNNGIIVSMPLRKILGLRNYNNTTSEKRVGGGHNMEFKAIFTVVDKGLGGDVVDAANLAGAKGATIINARGSGIHEKNTFFAMAIEPEKEMVMVIIRKDKCDDVIESINGKLEIDEPGKGILFVMDVCKTSGLYQGEEPKE